MLQKRIRHIFRRKLRSFNQRTVESNCWFNWWRPIFWRSFKFSIRLVKSWYFSFSGFNFRQLVVSLCSLEIFGWHGCIWALETGRVQLGLFYTRFLVSLLFGIYSYLCLCFFYLWQLRTNLWMISLRPLDLILCIFLCLFQIIIHHFKRLVFFSVINILRSHSGIKLVNIRSNWRIFGSFSLFRAAEHWSGFLGGLGFLLFGGSDLLLLCLAYHFI